MIVNNDYITKYTEILKESEKAYQMVFDPTRAAVWIPKSQVKVLDQQIKVMTLSHWLAIKNKICVDPEKEEQELRDKYGAYGDDEYDDPGDVGNLDPFDF